MKLMKEIADFQTGVTILVSCNHFISGVGADSEQDFLLKLKDKVDRMRGQNNVDQHGTEIADMLHRMHRHPRPWADIDVAVMERVNLGI